MFLPPAALLSWTTTRPPLRCEVGHDRGGRGSVRGGRSSVGDKRSVRHSVGDGIGGRGGLCSKQREESKSRRSHGSGGGSRRHCGNCSALYSIIPQL